LGFPLRTNLLRSSGRNCNRRGNRRTRWHFADIGVDDKWAKEVAASIPAGGSALFVLARNAQNERVLPEMAKFGGKVLKTSLSPEKQQALEEALSVTAA